MVYCSQILLRYDPLRVLRAYDTVEVGGLPRKLRELRRDLRQAGCVKIRQEGSHETWTHPVAPEVKVTLAGADGQDAKHYQEEQVSEALRAIRSRKKKP